MYIFDGGVRQGRSETRWRKPGSIAWAIQKDEERRAYEEAVCRRDDRVSGFGSLHLSWMNQDVYTQRRRVHTVSLTVVVAGHQSLASFRQAIPSFIMLQERYLQKVCQKLQKYTRGDPANEAIKDHEPYDAEHHLALGTRDSPSALANLEYDWYVLTTEPHTAPLFAARAIFPYLLVGNLRAANQCYLIFTSKLSSSNPGLAVQEVNSGPMTTFSTDKSTSPPQPSTTSKPPNLEFRVYASLPLLNFLGLLLLAIQRGAPELFRTLKTHYKEQLKELDGTWDEGLAQIGEMYFGIRIPSQSNPLMDMMGSFLMGGNAPKKQGQQGGRRIEGTSSPAPPAPAVD